MQPIGIGEGLRRKMVEAVMSIFKNNINISCRFITVMYRTSNWLWSSSLLYSQTFNEKVHAGVFPVDVTKAFNKINRKINFMSIFVSLCLYSYSLLKRLFLQGGKELKCLEETAYRDPIASSIYTIGILLLSCLNQTSNNFPRVHWRMISVEQENDCLGNICGEYSKCPTAGFYPNGAKLTHSQNFTSWSCHKNIFWYVNQYKFRREKTFRCVHRH